MLPRIHSQSLPLLALQVNTGAPINGPILLLTATIDWPKPFTVPLVDDYIQGRGGGVIMTDTVEYSNNNLPG